MKYEIEPNGHVRITEDDSRSNSSHRSVIRLLVVIAILLPVIILTKNKLWNKNTNNTSKTAQTSVQEANISDEELNVNDNGQELTNSIIYDDISEIKNGVDDNPYWVIFNEGYRDGRIELSTFNAQSDPSVIWNTSMYCDTQNGDCNQYYYDNGEWIQIGTYNKLTDYATNVIASNVDICDSYGSIVIDKYYDNIIPSNLDNLSTLGEKTTTTVKTADAIENDYDVFETSLFVHVDEADSLPLRDNPDRYNSSVETRIPDKTKVDVLGYKDTGSEIWFRLDYNGTKGWVRGGMLQPENFNDIWSEEYDLPGMDKWRSKFILYEEYKTYNKETYADFKGTLYFQPDLSSGVQKRFKSRVSVRVYGTSYDSSEWYYVGTGDSSFESGGFGWVYKSQLSW